VGPSPARALTFLAVVVAWVFFRSNSFGAAERVLTGMCGVNGFTLPGDFADVMTHLVLGPVLRHLAWAPSPLSILVGVLAAQGVIVWFAPNTQQIMGRFNRALNPYPESVEQPPMLAIPWRPSVGMVVLAGALFGLSLLGLLTALPPRFLYFQF
jgi:alginate O-acetyltransferase complex protein AlgI